MVVVTARVGLGDSKRLRELLAGAGPRDPAGHGLERHEVFVAADLVVFVFEGAQSGDAVRRLLPPELAETACVAEQVFSWERPIELDGVAYGPQPGPGDSDGG